MLFGVRKFFAPLIFTFAAVACLQLPLGATQISSSPKEVPVAAVQQAPAPAQPSSEQAAPSSSSQNAAPSPPSPAEEVPMVVLDPGHGGTNTGARGENGLAEKDVVLQIARTLQAQLQNHGYRVVLTRHDDSNPSYNDRAAIANAYRNAIFITLHVGSTGKMGTVRAFYDQLWTPIPVVPSFAQVPKPNATPGSPVAKPSANTLISWHQAQRPYLDASHRLASLLQLQFAQTFRGSPTSSIAAPLRDLRSVAHPAVAIEVSNISAPSASVLLALSGPLSVCIERSLQKFRQSAATGAQ